MKKLPQQLASLKKIFAYGNRIRPSRDWFVLLLCAGLLLVASVAWSLWLFMALANGKTLGPAPIAKEPQTQGSVNAVQTIFQARATEEGHYQGDYHFVDPSVPGR